MTHERDDGAIIPGGVMAALATPVSEAGRLDVPGLERLVAHAVAGGVTAVSPVGSTGEGPRLRRAGRVEVCRQVARVLPAGVPFFCGHPFSNLHDSIGELEEMAALGATAALVAPPSYFPSSPDTLTRLFEALAPRSPLPILLYNIPQFTKCSIPSRVVGHLAQHPGIVGLKDSSGDVAYLSQVLRAVRGSETFTVLTGSDALLVPGVFAGADGGILASAGVCPSLVVGAYAAAVAGRRGEAIERHVKVAALAAACGTGEFPSGWKFALCCAGLCQAHVLPPGQQLTGPARDELRRELEELGVLKDDKRVEVPGC